jgi:hypothetical protein
MDIFRAILILVRSFFEACAAAKGTEDLGTEQADCRPGCWRIASQIRPRCSVEIASKRYYSVRPDSRVGYVLSHVIHHVGLKTPWIRFFPS